MSKLAQMKNKCWLIKVWDWITSKDTELRLIDGLPMFVYFWNTEEIDHEEKPYFLQHLYIPGIDYAATWVFGSRQYIVDRTNKWLHDK